MLKPAFTINSPTKPGIYFVQVSVGTVNSDDGSATDNYRSVRYGKTYMAEQEFLCGLDVA